QPLNGKIYVATKDGVSLFRARAASGTAPNAPPCTVGGFADYVFPETGAAGTVALLYRAQANGFCSYPPNTYMTQIVSASGENSVPGIARLSTNGRYAIVFLAATARINNGVGLAFLDLQSVVQTPVNLASPAFPQYVVQPLSGGRVIANDGTALVAVSDGS